MQVLPPIGSWNTTFFLHPSLWGPGGMGLLNLTAGLGAAAAPVQQLGGQQFDVVLLVSPEYDVDGTAKCLEATRPRAALAWVHNGDSPHVRSLGKLLGGIRLLTLAPHVSGFLENRLRREGGGANVTVPWVLPVFEFKPAHPCAAGAAGGGSDAGSAGAADAPPVAVPRNSSGATCLDGFVLQGNIAHARRDYSRLWKQLLDLQQAAAANSSSAAAGSSAGSPRIHVVGSGHRGALGIPPQLDGVVQVQTGLPFPSFYEQIHRATGLLPALASRRYLTSKFSSTVVSSLITGTPLLADSQLLAAYSFLHPAAVLPQGEGEGEAAAMLRYGTAAGGAAVLEARAQLAALRAQLNSDARGKLEGLVGEELGRRSRL
jgi:hypothetical protein